METEQYTHPRVFNLSACLSTHWTNPYLPLETVHITHQVPYHYTKPTPVLLHTNPIQTVIYLTLYRFWTSQHPIFALPSKPYPIHGDIPAYEQLHPYQLHENTLIGYSLRKHFNTHLFSGKNYERGTLENCRSAYVCTACHSVHKTSSLKQYLGNL